MLFNFVKKNWDMFDGDVKVLGLKLLMTNRANQTVKKFEKQPGTEIGAPWRRLWKNG